MIVLIITNIVLTVVIGLAGAALLVEMARDSRPIIIKEAKALREYYEAKLKDAKEKTAKAEQNRVEYRGLYESELEKNRDFDSTLIEKAELDKQVERITKELNSCEDRLNDMAQENADLKEKIKALKKTATKGKKSKNAKD